MSTTPVFDGSLFDDAVFGGSSGLFDTEKFDPALFDAGLPPVLNARVFWAEIEVPAFSGTPRRALFWDGANLREVTDALLGTGKKPIVLLSGALKERAVSEGVAVVIVNGSLRCIDPATEVLLV